MSEEAIPDTADSDGFQVGPASGPITIGENRDGDNSVEIPIVNQDGSERKIQIIVGLRYGADAESLLASDTDPVSLNVTISGSEPVEMNRVSKKADATVLYWATPPRPKSAIDLGARGSGAGASARIRISGLASATPPGTAAVDIAVRVHDGTQWKPPSLKDVVPVRIGVSKVPAEGDDPVIDYFRVEPDFLLGAGQPVTVSFHGRNYDSYSLFRNNQHVGTWSEDGAHTFRDTPSITTVYRLSPFAPPSPEETSSEAGGDRAKDADRLNAPLYRTVQVISPGWNQLHLPQGYPTQMFVHNDFSGAGTQSGKRLYGIFMKRDSKGKMSAKLYSSQTGIDDWREEPGEVPLHMATSPGVAFDDRLWLIGGSSFDDNKASAEVWCYERKKPGDENDRERDWQRKQKSELDKTYLDLPKALACHACVVVPGSTPRISVLGGFSNGIYSDSAYAWRTGDDKWELAPDLRPADNFKRRLLAMATFQPPGSKDWQIWVNGGVGKSPDTIFTDTYMRDGAGAWVKQNPMQPHLGYPLASALVMSPSPDEVLNNLLEGGEGKATHGRDRHRLFLVGTFLMPSGDAPQDTLPLAPPRSGVPGPNVTVSRILEWHSKNHRWEAHEVGRGWETYSGAWFRMQAISFGGFLFVWSLHTRIAELGQPKLNVLVPG